MTSSSLPPKSARSRRELLNIALLAGATGVVGAAMSQKARAAQVKLAKADAAYQDKPKGKQRCDGCVQWQPPAGCKVVAGIIAPAGWCSLYAPAKA